MESMDVTVHGLPVGFRFNPTAEELISAYLIPRRNGNSSIIRDVDLYGNLNPWTLFHVTDSSEKHCFYVFTELKKKEKQQKPKSKHFIRSAGSGSWFGRNRIKVYDADGNMIGMNRYYTFSVVDDKEQHGRWTMHEYSLVDENENSLDGFVVCAIGCNTNISIDPFDPKKSNNRNKTTSCSISVQVPSISTSTVGFEEKLDSNNYFDDCQINSKKRKSASVAVEFEEEIYNNRCFDDCERNSKKRKVDSVIGSPCSVLDQVQEELDSTSDDLHNCISELLDVDLDVMAYYNSCGNDNCRNFRTETVDVSINTSCFSLDRVPESSELIATEEVRCNFFTEPMVDYNTFNDSVCTSMDYKDMIDYQNLFNDPAALAQPWTMCW